MPDALPKNQGNPDLAIALTYYSPYVSGLTTMARDIAAGDASPSVLRRRLRRTRRSRPDPAPQE